MVKDLSLMPKGTTRLRQRYSAELIDGSKDCSRALVIAVSHADLDKCWTRCPFDGERGIESFLKNFVSRSLLAFLTLEDSRPRPRQA